MTTLLACFLVGWLVMAVTIWVLYGESGLDDLLIAAIVGFAWLILVPVALAIQAREWAKAR